MSTVKSLATNLTQTEEIILNNHHEERTWPCRFELSCGTTWPTYMTFETTRHRMHAGVVYIP